jgi:hypothetical protein
MAKHNISENVQKAKGPGWATTIGTLNNKEKDDNI